MTRKYVVTLLAWAFLTAGIILGMWWAYMELGWGGYWAWDPVENASLIPWLISTAALHTLIVQERRNKLHRVNVALMCLTTISAFFATYLVRSGVVQSVHAFGDGSVGTPLTVFVLGGLLISFWAAFAVPARGRELAGIVSREGFLVMVCWLLLALSVIILVGTMWPVISLLWTPEPHGLDANFYNRVCVPLGMLIMLLLMVCPWLRWDGGLRDAPRFWLALGAFVASGAAFFFLGYRQPVALLAAAYFVLSITLTIKTPYLEITFKSLPVVVGALMFGPVGGGLVALFGELLAQMIGPYGLMPTTVLWLLPPLTRGLLLGAVAAAFSKRGSQLEKRPLMCYGVCLGASIVTSCVTTVCLWLDSLIYHYYNFALIFGSALVRFGKEIVVTAVVTSLAIPMVRLLRRMGRVSQPA